MINMNDIESIQMDRKEQVERVMREGWKIPKREPRKFAFKFRENTYQECLNC